MPDCVGCGFCCMQAPCCFGAADESGRCLALHWDGQQYRCLLADIPLVYEGMAMGEGCCSSLNTWRKDVKERG